MTDAAATGIAGTWMRFWFTPADSRPLAVVRIATAAVGLALLWSYAGDLTAWFGPGGVLPTAGVAAWRSPFAFSLFDFATTPATLTASFAATLGVFVMLLVGLFTPAVSVVAAVLWASLMNRGPMLAGPADDCLAILLWCLAAGPAGDQLSIDRMIRDRRGRPAAQPSWRARLSLGLLQLHASAIAAAAAVAQLKGDIWWNGTAAWWLAAREESRLFDLTGIFAGSELAMNAVTHGIVLFEIVFAVGLWFNATQRTVARVGLVAWPLVGMIAGEPLWGLTMAVLATPAAIMPPPEAAA